MSIFNEQNKVYSLKTTMFLDDNATSIARYDKVKYPQFDILTQQQLGFFWRPEEVPLLRDVKDFRDLKPHEQHIFTSNLKRQIVLDSVQGRAPIETFGPICSLPELENWLTTWTFSETIHSRSYTHIIRNVYSDPSVIFDDILNIPEIVDCAKDISKYYDELEKWNNRKSWIDINDPDHWSAQQNKKQFNYQHKKAIWMALNAVNALEGVRFYVSFACSFSFAENKTMEGNAKIIRFICRDENLHLASTQKMIMLLPTDDPDFATIRDDCADEVKKMFESVVEQEKTWADYLFKDGSMLGLNANILKDYVEFIAHRRMKAIGIDSDYQIKTNPLPWMNNWVSSANTQVAPQETTISSYIVGGINQDVTDDLFKDVEIV